MTGKTDHACAVDECTKPLPVHILMCRPHWRMVPKPMQRDVTGSWRLASRVTAQEPGDPDRVRKVRDYLVARQAAVDLVNGKVSRE